MKYGFSYGHWLTGDEISFLKDLGRYAVGCRNLLRRKELLAGYIEGAALRKNWGEMDRDAVMDYALQLVTAQGCTGLIWSAREGR